MQQVFLKKIIPLLQEYFYEDWEKIQIVLADIDPEAEREDRKTKQNAIIQCGHPDEDRYYSSVTDQDLLLKRSHTFPKSIKPESIKKIYES